LLHEVILLIEDVIADASEVSVLQICIEVDLDDTISDRVKILLLGRSRSSVENQEDWLVLLCSNGILDILLVLTEKFGVELDITGLVDTVDVTKSGSDGEVW
jgi:hypothetical protein